jgi:uncharacterized membrane protein HdeD (DUF308 family)
MLGDPLIARYRASLGAGETLFMSDWFWWLVVGGIMLIGGVVALSNPFAATVTAESIAGGFFVLGGVVQVVAFFRSKRWSERIWALLLAIVFLGLGLALLANPLAGILSLTLIAAIWFLASGLTKVYASFSIRGTGYFWPVMISGVISIALALMTFSNFPQSAAVLLGVLLGVELLSSGVTLVSYALFARGKSKRKLERV